MNRWDRFWRSMDRARLFVRVMVVAQFTALFLYIAFVSTSFFTVVEMAMDKNLDMAGTVSILGAITAFASFTIPQLTNIFLKTWHDYRQSGVDWKSISDKTGES